MYYVAATDSTFFETVEGEAGLPTTQVDLLDALFTAEVAADDVVFLAANALCQTRFQHVPTATPSAFRAVPIFCVQGV